MLTFFHISSSISCHLIPFQSKSSLNSDITFVAIHKGPRSKEKLNEDDISEVGDEVEEPVIVRLEQARQGQEHEEIIPTPAPAPVPVPAPAPAPVFDARAVLEYDSLIKKMEAQIQELHQLAKDGRPLINGLIDDL